MNRLVIIGNGFDLAHGLETSYNQFIDWYWECVKKKLNEDHGVYKDSLCRVSRTFESGKVYNRRNDANCELAESKGLAIFKTFRKYPDIFHVKVEPFLSYICDIAIEKWVDIENEYYKLLKKCAQEDPMISEYTPEALNKQLNDLKILLAKYLREQFINKPLRIKAIDNAIYGPISLDEIAVSSSQSWKEYVAGIIQTENTEWRSKIKNYNLDYIPENFEIEEFLRNSKVLNKGGKIEIETAGNWHGHIVPDLLMRPDNVLLLSFNYTSTEELYKKEDISEVNHIHGTIDNPRSMIFGFGDELDDAYLELEKQENNSFMENIKSIRYSESANYRNLLKFIESEPYQVVILGHSCGNSDRTLLHSIFEHENCISIKPYYYKPDKDTDKFLDLSQSICRNFKNKKLFRDRLVSKERCAVHPQQEDIKPKQDN